MSESFSPIFPHLLPLHFKKSLGSPIHLTQEPLPTWADIYEFPVSKPWPRLYNKKLTFCFRSAGPARAQKNCSRRGNPLREQHGFSVGIAAVTQPRSPQGPQSLPQQRSPQQRCSPRASRWWRRWQPSTPRTDARCPPSDHPGQRPSDRRRTGPAW